MIHKICDDSRKVGLNDAYVCISSKEKGLAYVQEALKKGAIVYGMFSYEHHRYFKVNHKQDFEVLLETFYQFDLSNIKVIGVCGTNGKTSVASMLYANLKKEAMLISTHHIYCKNKHFSIRNTTPNAFELAEYIQYAMNQSCKYIVMEVSSHAIDQRRIFFLRYDFIIYTNITSDHLDYHLCSTHYIFTKLKLRKYVKQQGQIVAYPELPYLNFVQNNQWHILSHPICLFKAKQNMSFCWEKEQYQIPYQSDFHMENAVQALYVLQKLGFDDVKERMKHLPLIHGRCEVLIVNGVEIWIDYAHSEDGLLKLLKNVTLKEGCRCICVVGCGGNRDQQKRSKMGQIACLYSDLAIYTSDNPRDEKVFDIMKMMMNHQEKNYKVIENRYCAIKFAMKFAKKGDIIIVAGKGDEQTQEIKGNFYPFHDKSCIKQIIKEDLLWNGS